MNSVTRLELKKLNNRKNYLIGIVFFVMIIVVMLTRSSTDVLNSKGEIVRGIGAWQVLRNQGISSDGWLTVDHIKKEREKYKNSIDKLYVEGIRTDYKALGIKLEYPQRVLFTTLNFPYRPFGTLHADMNLNDREIEEFYKNWPVAMERYLREPYLNYNEQQIKAIAKKAGQIKTPFYYEYNQGWSQLHYMMILTFYIFLIFLGFILCDLFAKDSENGIEQILLSAQDSRKNFYLRKLRAAEIFSSIAYLCYIGLLLIYSAIVFSLHGGNSSIQFYMVTNIFSLTTWQAFFIDVIVGYFSTIVIIHLILFLSALFKRGKIALLICIIYLYLVNEYGRSISVSIQNIMYFIPQQFIRWAMSTEKLTVIGSLVIPYALVSIFLSIAYILIFRILTKVVMKNYYIS